jgi:Na+/phosphate symporter
VPPDVELGKAGLRLVQGAHKSKSRDLLVRPQRVRRLIRNLVGGLALLLLGVRLLSQGMRRLAGKRLRGLLGVWTRGRPRAVGTGVLLGALAQLTTSASTVTVGLLESRLISVAAAVALLAGAQLGAALAGALLPVALAREALFVVAIGMTWVLLAGDKRQGGIGYAVLGTGLVLYGLHLLQTGFQPLASSPQLLRYIAVLERDDVVGWIACAAIGAMLASILQGPGPVFWLVVGLAQTTGALPLPCALAVMAGTSLGAALATLPIALSSGPRGRRLAVAQLAIGAISTIVVLATAPLWLKLADAIVPGAPDKVAYGKKVLLPHVALHLGVAYVCAQLGATVAGMLAMPWLVRRADRARSGDAAVSKQTTDERHWLIDVFHAQATGLHATLELCCTGDRAAATAAERALGGSRRKLEALPPSVGTGTTLDAGTPLQTALATLQLQRALEELLHVAELAVERDVSLGPDDLTGLRAMHELCSEGMTALVVAVQRGEPPDLEGVRAREIRLNAFEAEGRRRVREPKVRDSVGLRLGAIELLDGYEGVGNHIFRVSETLDSDADLA